MQLSGNKMISPNLVVHKTINLYIIGKKHVAWGSELKIILFKRPV